ncbi:hypothetical protein CRG98_046721 [Punica granatum]|uniref:Uncharacterized protein n=1 Tax=Punica granatum TaxID=22663 RepID=A0A2I0HMI2_PUNGR|nr:hypothetical protein CRG98_046721 [Punica granatum]
MGYRTWEHSFFGSAVIAALEWSDRDWGRISVLSRVWTLSVARSQWGFARLGSSAWVWAFPLELTLVGEFFVLLGYLPVKTIPLNLDTSKLEEEGVSVGVSASICGGLVGSLWLVWVWCLGCRRLRGLDPIMSRLQGSSVLSDERPMRVRSSNGCVTRSRCGQGSKHDILYHDDRKPT